MIARSCHIPGCSVCAPGDEVNEEGGPGKWIRHKYIEKLLSKLVPKIETEMQTRQEDELREHELPSHSTHEIHD